MTYSIWILLYMLCTFYNNAKSVCLSTGINQVLETLLKLIIDNSLVHDGEYPFTPEGGREARNCDGENGQWQRIFKFLYIEIGALCTWNVLDSIATPIIPEDKTSNERQVRLEIHARRWPLTGSKVHVLINLNTLCVMCHRQISIEMMEDHWWWGVCYVEISCTKSYAILRASVSESSIAVTLILPESSQISSSSRKWSVWVFSGLNR